MFVTLEQFFKDYRIKNGQFPNETVMNRGTFRLKREIRELKTYFDIMQNKPLEDWSPSRVYELDEYVSYKGFIFKSCIDGNINDEPDVRSTWERVNLKTFSDIYPKLKSNTFTSKDQQRSFTLDFNTSSVTVFLDGVLQDQTSYTFDNSVVSFNQPLEEGRTVTVIAAVAYTSAVITPRFEFKAEQDQYIFEPPFQIEQPAVFLNGDLLPEKAFTYTAEAVELETPANKDDIVVVVNGTPVGDNLYSNHEIDELLSKYYLKEETYSKGETDNLLDALPFNDYRLITDSYSKRDIDNSFALYYTKSEIDELLTSLAYTGTRLSDYGITDAYTITQTDNLLDAKADKAALDQFRVNVQAQLDTKADLADTLAGYGILDAYTKDQVDAFLNVKADKGSNLSEYGITDAYTKAEIDALLDGLSVALTDDPNLRRLLSQKADKASTLSGYGITDTYTKLEITDLLSQKADTADLEVNHLTDTLNTSTYLNATYLDGLAANQFLRSDKEDTQQGGVDFVNHTDLQDRCSVHIDTSGDIPEIEMYYKAEADRDDPRSFYKVPERVFTSCNSSDLFYIAEGDFEGTWWVSLYDLGLLDLNAYNYTVSVFPLQQGNALDFIPKTYKSGFTFNTVRLPLSDETSFYHYGYVDATVLKLYSWSKTDQGFNPIPAHYRLTAVRKEVSTVVTVNQNESIGSTQFKHEDNAAFAHLQAQMFQKNDRVTPVIPEILEDNLADFLEETNTYADIATEKPLINRLCVHSSDNILFGAETFFVTVKNGKPGAEVQFTIRGDAQFVRLDESFDELGVATAVLKGIEPFETQIVVTAVSQGYVSDFVVINPFAGYVDDPDTTLNLDVNGFDNTVFTSGDESTFTDDPDTTLVFDTNTLDNSVFTTNNN